MILQVIIKGRVICARLSTQKLNSAIKQGKKSDHYGHPSNTVHLNSIEKIALQANPPYRAAFILLDEAHMSHPPIPVAVITGCSSGIGLALCAEYARQGHRVYAGLRNLDTQQETLLQQLSQILGNNPAALASIQSVQLDVNSAQDIANLAADLNTQTGRVDVLINNAGFGAMGALIDIEPETLTLQFATNVMAPINITRALLPLLNQASLQPQREKHCALVANIGSVSGILTTPFSGAYCASKAAVHSVSDALRMELRPFAINVACLRPGTIASAFGDNSEEQAKRNLPAHSLYRTLEAAILKRARASQNNPTSAEEFARQAFIALSRNRPASVSYIGNSSWVMPRLRRWLPDRLLDAVLRRMFKLDATINLPIEPPCH